MIRRLTKQQAEFRDRLTKKGEQGPPPQKSKRKWPSRPFQTKKGTRDAKR